MWWGGGGRRVALQMPVPNLTTMFLAINGRWSLNGQKRFHSSKKSFDCRSGKLKSLELGTVKGDGAMATASKHVRKLLDGLANQAETAPLTHKVRDFTRLVATSINHTFKRILAAEKLQPITAQFFKFWQILVIVEIQTKILNLPSHENNSSCENR